MLTLTKIFHFEMAHAIYGYPGTCKDIHGHSYQLEVTVTSEQAAETYLPTPGFVIDFKELKQFVNSSIIQVFDHKLILSKAFLDVNPGIQFQENLIAWEVEPTAENILIYIQDILVKKLPVTIKLSKLKLYETKDSYVEWVE